MRHPLRNEYDAMAPRLMSLARYDSAQGCEARAMLALLPAFVDVLEAERDAGTSKPDLYRAMVGVIANLTAQTVALTHNAFDRRAALRRLLSITEAETLRRVDTFGPLTFGN